MAKTKFEKMFPTKEQNIETGQKAAKNHRDHLHSQKSVDGKDTSRLTKKYEARKKRLRPNAPKKADFFLTGKMSKSFKVNKRSTSSKAIVYSFISYLKEDYLSLGLSSRHKKKVVYANKEGKHQIPKSTQKILVNDFSYNTKGNLRRLLKDRKDFKITITV